MGYKRDSGSYGTAREDPIAASFRWREELGWNSIQAVQENCGKTMKTLGYSLLNEDNMKDPTFYTTDPGWFDTKIHKKLSSPVN